MRKWLAFLVCLSFLASAGSRAQNNLIDSLRLVISNLPDDSVKVDNLILVSQNLARTDPESAIAFGQRAKALSEGIGYQAGRALALKYIGFGYYSQGMYLQTIDYWEQSLAVFTAINDLAGVSNILSNLGGLNQDQGDDTRALELLLRSLAISEQINDTLRIATAMQNIGLVYSKKQVTHNKAREYYLKALPLFEKLHDDVSVAYVQVNLGELSFYMQDYSTALYYFNTSLNAFKGTADESYSLNYIGRVYARRGEYEQALSNQKQALLLARGMNATLDVAKALLGLAETYSLQGQTSMALESYREANALAEESGFKEEMRDTYEGLATSYAEIADFRNAFRYQKLLTAIKDTLFYTANQKKLDLINANFDSEKKQVAIDLLTKDKALQEVSLENQKLMTNAVSGGFILILSIAFIIYRNYRIKVKTNKLLDKQNAEIEELLLNILPVEVARELQHDGYATPRNYESATVLFTDFKGFTGISSGLLPHELIAELNSYFNEFDDIIGKHNLEKIKTIGDAYMCAGGIPSTNTTHPIDAVEAGLAIQEYIAIKNKRRIANGQAPWELRVGIHTGQIVAGVVGSKKYAYDIWGDAVNIASRMESNGEAGKVNISEVTYQLIKDKFKCVDRGEIAVKGAGDRHMYFVEGPIIPKTTNKATIKPNITS